jgi:hypothetical protein
MAEPTPSDMAPLKQGLHGLNNRVGVILATAELLQLEQLPHQAASRRQTIKDKALEVREIVRAISDHYFSDANGQA